jgi:ribosomal protein S7
LRWQRAAEENRRMLNPFAHRKILKKGIPGKATVVARGALDRGATSFNLPMTLHVYVEGRTPYEVEDQWMVKAKDTGGLSGWIPVRVDPDDRERVAIDWDGVRANYEQEKAARREALANSGPVGARPEGIEQAEQALRAMGLDIDLSSAQVTYGSPVEVDLGGDDTISQLERLAALRDAGVLTEDEFAAQKQRILGSAEH